MSIPSSAPSRFAAGFALPLRAFNYLVERPVLWRDAFLPVVLTVAGLAAGLTAAVPLSGIILGSLWGESRGLLAVAWWLTRAAVYLVLVFVAAVAIPVAASMPFTDRLSARVEALEIGAAGEGGLSRAAAEVWTGVAHSLARLAILLVGHVILLPSLILPFLYPVLAFAWTARWTAVEYLDLPMARNLHRFGDVRAALKDVRPLGTGFGLALATLFLVPFADLLVIPIGAVAGTLLYCDLIRSGHVERARIAPPAGPGSATTSRSMG